MLMRLFFSHNLFCLVFFSAVVTLFFICCSNSLNFLISSDAIFVVDLLSAFPPKSLKLKKPFAVQPWINSEENIGNLLMVCHSGTFHSVLDEEDCSGKEL